MNNTNDSKRNADLTMIGRQVKAEDEASGNQGGEGAGVEAKINRLQALLSNAKN